MSPQWKRFCRELVEIFVLHPTALVSVPDDLITDLQHHWMVHLFGSKLEILRGENCHQPQFSELFFKI